MPSLTCGTSTLAMDRVPLLSGQWSILLTIFPPLPEYVSAWRAPENTVAGDVHAQHQAIDQIRAGRQAESLEARDPGKETSALRHVHPPQWEREEHSYQKKVFPVLA